MKRIGFLFILLFAVLFFSSCQKELNYDLDGISEGTLKSNTTGDCLPSTINGIYYADSILGTEHFIDVQVNVTATGTYTIVSDTVNGYSFRGQGTFGILGLNTVRLYGTGKPLVSEVDIFTITYGASSCKLSITVAAAGTGVATYTLQSASSGECSGANVFGTYTAGVPLGVTHSVILTVNVISPGTFLLGAASVNGMIFSASGVFVNTGVQAVTLNGSGLPLSPGTFNVTATNILSSCTFSVIVGGTSAASVYSLGGAPGSCTGAVLSGTYQSGLAMNSSNTAVLNINVSTAGNYSIVSNVVNGVSFSASGVFSIGNSTVTLLASGTPVVAGIFSYRIPGFSDSCTFSVNFVTPPPPAVFTLAGAPGICSPITVNGTYTVGNALDATNTANVSVNVTTAGAYTISTNTVNGISFSGSGIFTTTGIQTVTLTGSGAPVAVVPTTLTPQAGTSSCTFDVTVNPAAPGVFTCKIDGVFISFNVQAHANYPTFPTKLTLDGYAATTGPEELTLRIDKQALGGTAIAAGSYTNTLSASQAGKYILYGDYFDATGAQWTLKDVTTGSPDPFTITITSITASRVQGTFSGTIRDFPPFGTNTRIVTEGIFDLPIQ